MPDWLIPYFEPEQLVIAVSGLVALIGTIWGGLAGVRKGKPTSAAVAAAVAPDCRGENLIPVLENIITSQKQIAEDLDELKTIVERQRDMLVKIEDRTTRI